MLRFPSLKIMKTTITFDDKHLPVIMKALEAYERFKMGQVDYAVLEVIADPKAELPVDGRETCRIYEDMALEAIGKIHGSNPGGLGTGGQQ